MATIGSTPRPAYVYDQETDTWVPVGVGPHSHDTFIPNTIIDAKGDLLAGSAPDTVGKLTVGANGTLLVADSTETLGLAWKRVLNTPNSTTVGLTVTANTAIGTAPTGTVFRTVGADATTSIILMDGAGGGSAGQFVGRRANGTIASPTSTLSSNFLSVFGGRGYGTTGYITSDSANIVMHAGENFTDTAYGGYITFNTTPLSTVAVGPTERMRVGADGNINIGPVSSSVTGLLSINSNAFNTVPRSISLGNSRTYTAVDTGGVMVVGLANNGTIGTHDYGAISFAARNGFADGGASTVSLFSGGGSSNRTNTYKFIESNSGSAGVFDLSFWTLGVERARIDQFGSLQLGQILENIAISTTALTGTNGHWLSVFKGVGYYTTAASGNWTFDLVYNGTTSLNSVMPVNQSMTVTMLVTQGATPRFTSGLNIDGVAQTVKWQGGLAPANGNANSIDAYTFTVIKTANATYTVLGSQTRFA